MSNTALQKKIMRRIYYAYMISIGVHPVFWQGMFLGAAALLLADWLHVASIYHNLLAVPLGQVPQYMIHAFLHAFTAGEAVTAITLVAAGALTISAGYHIARAIVGHAVVMRV